MAIKDEQTPIRPVQRAAKEEAEKRNLPHSNPARQPMAPSPAAPGEARAAQAAGSQRVGEPATRLARPATPETPSPRAEAKPAPLSEVRAQLSYDERLAVMQMVTAIQVEHGLTQLSISSFLRVLVRLALENKDKVGRVPPMEVTRSPAKKDTHAVRDFENRLQQYVYSLLKG